MKKYIILVLVLAYAAFLFIGCGQNPATQENEGLSKPIVDKETNGIDKVMEDRRPMVMIKDEIYMDTGRESDIGARCGVMDGGITSTVKPHEIPIQNNQSNFGEGYGYQYVDKNSIDIYINQKWIRFEKEEDTWGIQLTATKITPTGLTLVCNQSGGNPEGDLQTGSLYWLESQIDNDKDKKWIPVETLELEHDIAWTAEAWIIPMNDFVEWEVNWKWLYGELPAGKYRIGKEIMDFKGTGDYDLTNYYAYFEIVKQ